MKLLIISLFLLGLQGCILNEFEGNVYDTNNDILWRDIFTGENRCIEKTAQKALKLQGSGAQSWDCFLHEKATP